MNIVDCGISSGAMHGAAVPLPSAGRALHRLADVREQQGLTRRTLARRLGIDVNMVKHQEQPTTDLPLSVLYRWREALDVPVAELLVDSDEPLSAPIMKRAQMVRVMKTAQAIQERAQQVGIRRMAQMLVEQLIEVMPELEHVSPWHTVGRRRTQDEVGQAASRRISPDILRHLGE